MSNAESSTAARSRPAVRALILALSLAASLAAGFGLSQLVAPAAMSSQGDTDGAQKANAGAAESKRPDVSMADLDKEVRAISEWDGEVLLVNFWATWCPPCLREIPVFIDLQDELDEQGFQVIGIAIDDRKAVQDFADTMGITYPVLVGQDDGIEASKAFGNRLGALPFTAIVDRDGVIVYKHRGEMTRDDVLTQVEPLL